METRSIDSLTPEELLEIAESMGLENRFVLMKRGLYYRPNGHGYTDAIEAAWVLSSEEADKHVYPHDEPVTKHPAPLPAFGSDANAALTLADALARGGWKHAHYLTTTGIRFIFSRGYTNLNTFEKHESISDTFPLALSRAYLAVIRSTKNAQ